MAEATRFYANQTFVIHGVRLAVAADEEWVREGVSEALRPFRAPVRPAEAAMVLMAGRNRDGDRHGLCSEESGSDALPPEAIQFRFGAMRCYRTDDLLVYSDGASTVIVDPDRARAEGTVCRGEGEPAKSPWRAWQHPVFTFPLLELLRHRGLYHLHAAAVERDGMGVVLAGDSGCGKTTLTLLLARAGWGFLSDDAVLLRLTSSGVEARALPSAFHVDPALCAAFPELVGLQDAEPYNQEGKREVWAEHAFGRGFTPSATPRVLLLPRIHRESEPPPAEPAAPGIWLRRIAPGQAVAELIRASALVLLDPRAAAGHLESLRRLATGCTTYRLYHGPQALQQPDTFVAEIEKLIVEAGHE